MRAAIAFAASIALAACADGGASCDQSSVDGCYADVGCDGGGVCSLVPAEMNDLCACLGALGCDQAWYHAYCDAAPYAEDGGCPICGE